LSINTSGVGVPVAYGRQGKAWKYTVKQVGHTKRSLARGRKSKKNDGRAPDTAKDLLGKKARDRNQKTESNPDPKPPVKIDNVAMKNYGYIWHRNSCWLDSSLQVLYVTVMGDWLTFESRLSDAPTSSHVIQLFKHLDNRRRLEQASDESQPDFEDVMDTLSTYRSILRGFLF
jgi:hypothetical protein